jgi:fumarylacetoacetate (FAA) hydrolase family protein
VNAAASEDRDEPGQGFTHKMGDTVTIRSRNLGALDNQVGRAEELPEWSFGLQQLFAYLQHQRAQLEPW